MDEYIVSARKYRPDTFESVVGQDAITQTLKNSIRNNQLGQAYLFCGPRGVGKTTCARIFAKTINCNNPTAEHEPCNECESCRAFIESRSFNIHELDAASNNSVEDIRVLIDQVRIPPQLGQYSVYIIDEVHMLSQSAFNAFLKTLEEPPKHAIFILATTERHKILPTILSRCQIFDFNRISVEDIRLRLAFVAQRENITAESDALHVIAQKADGAMRDALSIFDQIVSFCGKNITYQDTIKNLNVLDYEVYFKITNAILSGSYTDTLMIFDEVLRKGFEGGYFINGLASHYRDLLVCKDPGTISLIEVGDKTKERYLEFAQKCSAAFLFNAIQITNTCDMSYRSSQNKRLLIELSLLKLCQLATNIFTLPQPTQTVTTPQQNATMQQVTQQQVQAKVAQPAPATNVVSQPAAQPKSTDAKTNLLNTIVGLNGNKNGDTTSKNDVTINLNNYGTKEYSSADVLTAWLNFVADTCPEGTRWNSYFKNHLPEQVSENTYNVRIEDAKTCQRLQEKKATILNYVRAKLDNRNFDFNYIVDEKLIEEKNQVVKTQSEQLEDLKKSNPDLAGILSDNDFQQV